MTSKDLPRPVVPRPVAVVRDFVNTTDHETGTDDLTTPAALVGYLRTEGLLDGTATAPATASASEDDLALALTLRRGLRTALEHNHDGVAGPIPELETALASLPVRLTWDGTEVGVGAGGGDGGDVVAALARIGLAAQQAASEGIWHRLKICASDECEWAYYDRSKNRSRSWCEYGCGNRIKTRAYRARQKQA